jgi:putative solute:sodium symporter small subunit
LSDKISTEVAEAHWAKTKRLMRITLIIWAIFGFIIQFFAVPLNSINIIGFPLGYYMAAQGSLIAFVILIFWFASKQNGIDEEFDVAED